MAPAADIIHGLGGNPDTGMCRCPAHDDKTPSLSVSDGRKGAILHCHAGCSQEAVLDALRQRGLWPIRSNEPERRHRVSQDTPDEFERWQKAWKILRAARIADERPAAYLRARGIEVVPANAMLLPPEKCYRLTGQRYPAMVLPITDGKTMLGAHVTWLSRDGNAKLAVSDRRPRRMFGRAKGGFVQLAKIDRKAPLPALVIGEGIESTLSAMQIAGLPGVAALSAGNLAKLRPRRAGEYIIAADNDNAGRKAAAIFAERLVYEGRKVRIAIPPAKGTDWNDVLCDGEDAAIEVWRAALERLDSEELHGSVSALDEERFMELTFPKRELLLEPWLPRPGLSMVYAPKGAGKTWFALAVGKAVAGGNDVLGWHCPGDGRVLYVEGELPGQSVQDRLSKFDRSPQGMFHVLCRDTYLLRRQTMPDLGDPEGRQELDRIIKHCKPDLIIIDTISTMVRTGVENEAESWAPIQAWLLTHRWQGRTVLLMHHSGKSGKQRGTSKREDVMDTIIGLRKQPDECTDTESAFDLAFDKSRDFFGEDAEPMRVRFSIAGGQATWRGDKLRDERKEQVREMLEDGVKQKDIADALGVTPGRVSQIVKALRDENVSEFPARGGRKRDEE